MALFIEGMECRLCGKPMMLAEGIELLPPLTSDRTDPIWDVSDSAVPIQCLKASPLAGQVNKLLKQLGFDADE